MKLRKSLEQLATLMCATKLKMDINNKEKIMSFSVNKKELKNWAQ